jgi:hypothetical protein
MSAFAGRNLRASVKDDRLGAPTIILRPEATADVVDPRRRTWLADSHFLDQRLKGPELSIDLAKRASGRQLEPGSE